MNSVHRSNFFTASSIDGAFRPLSALAAITEKISREVRVIFQRMNMQQPASLGASWLQRLHAGGHGPGDARVGTSARNDEAMGAGQDGAHFQESLRTAKALYGRRKNDFMHVFFSHLAVDNYRFGPAIDDHHAPKHAAREERHYEDRVEQALLDKQAMRRMDTQAPSTLCAAERQEQPDSPPRGAPRHPA